MSKNTTWERTFILLKPDAVKRSLVGTILARFERAGLTITAMKIQSIERKKAEEHYQSHKEKVFFEPLVQLLISGPVVVMVLEGAHAISVVRKLVGVTEPKEASPGSIRGDFCHMGYERSHERLGVIPNLIHASDSPQSAASEIKLWFDKSDFVSSYERSDADFL